MANLSNKETPTENILLKAMELAWKDHHHARDQTWKSLQIVAIFGAGMLTISINDKGYLATLCSSLLVIIAAIFGILVTWNHRTLERRKFIHLMNCEELLGLHRNDLIPLDPEQKLVGLELGNNRSLLSHDQEMMELIEDSEVKVPKKFKPSDIFNFKRNSTALFILRMHIAIIIFSLLVVLSHILGG